MKLTEFKDGEIVRTRVIETLNKERISFGRSTKNDYTIGRGNATCSRVQATMIKHGSEWLVVDGTTDELSRNGVFYNGKRITGPLVLKSGMEVDIFLGRTELIQLKNVQEGLDLTEGFSSETESEIIEQLRADIAMLQERLNKQEEQLVSIHELTQQSISTLKRDMADRLDGLSVDLKRALAEADRRAELRNQQQDQQLLNHSTELNVHRLVLSVIVAGICGWNATKAADQMTAFVNAAGVLGSLTAGGSQFVRPRGPRHATIPTLTES